LNAGDEGPDPGVSSKPPLVLGSGKLGTPLERMHCANSNSSGKGLPDEPDEPCEDFGWVVVVEPDEPSELDEDFD
jgi:hypothetical protein